MVLPMVVPQKFGAWHPHTPIFILDLNEIRHRWKSKIYTHGDLHLDSQIVVCRNSYEFLLKNRVKPLAFLPKVLSKPALYTLTWTLSPYLHPMVTQVLSKHALCTLTWMVSPHLHLLVTNFVMTLRYIRTMTLIGFISYGNLVLPGDTLLDHLI